jgi:hypothetical protein
MVILFADDSFDPDIDYHLGADIARSHFAIKCRPIKRDAQLGRLANGILLGVGGADAVLGGMSVFVNDSVKLMADLVAVRQAHWRADIAGGENLLVSGDNAAGTTARLATWSAIFIKYSSQLGRIFLAACGLPFSIFDILSQ